MGPAGPPGASALADYVLELAKASLNASVDDAALLARCADGCEIALGARSSHSGANWLPALRIAKSCRLSVETDPLGATGRYWSLDDDCTQAMGLSGAGIDGDGNQDVVARVWGSTCVLADYPRTGLTYGADAATGLSLFYFDDASTEDVEPDFTCVLVVSD